MKKNKFLLSAALMLSIGACNNATKTITENKKEDCCKKVTTPLSCKLTTKEQDIRKATVLKSLREQVLEKKEQPNGYAFKFNGSDKMINELADFAETERHCCDFFTFNISITGDTSFVWFNITGPAEAKEFIKTELEL